MITISGRSFKGTYNPERDTSALALFARPYYKRGDIHLGSSFWANHADIIKCDIDAQTAAEGLKISFGYDILVTDCTITGGYEDCVDIVRGSNIIFKNCTFIGNKTKHHITIKGSAHTVLFEDCKFINPYRKWYDGATIDLGNWTNYDIIDRPKTRNIVIRNCKTVCTSHITVRTIHAEDPIVYDSDVKVIRVPKLFKDIFWWCRRRGWLGNSPKVDERDLKIYDQENRCFKTL